jgi:predicted transcriptional regulator
MGYPSKAEAVRVFHARGMNAIQIAKHTGISRTRVNGYLSVDRQKTAMVRLTLRADTIQRLRSEAAQRGIDGPDLCRKIIEVVIADSMIDAVLDE